MHVGINARALTDPQPGGCVQAGRHLVGALAARGDLELTLFGHGSLGSTFDCRVDSTGCPTPSQVYGLAWEQIVVPRLVDRHDVDVLFTPTGNSPLRPCSVPVVTYLHDDFSFRGHAGRVYSHLQRVRLPRMVRHVDVLGTVSEFARDCLAVTFDITPAEIPVVYNGVDTYFRSDSPGDPVETPAEYLLFVGAKNRRKNFRGLVSAYEHLRSRTDLDPALVVAGPPPKGRYESIETTLARPAVHDLGYVSRAQLKTLYENAAAFVYPSLLETFGLPPLEAMACGTPVVASNRSCIPEILGDAAAFVDPDDVSAVAAAIEAVLTDQDRRETLVQRGHDRAGQFTWERAAEQTVAVLENAIEDD